MYINQMYISNLFNHLKNITYNPEYISQFTGKTINKINIVKKFFTNVKESKISNYQLHPIVIKEAYTKQLDDYLASLYKYGDPITKGETWKPCNYCGNLFASQGGLELHLRYNNCLKKN